MKKFITFFFIIPANIAVARSYLSAATKFSERTQAVSMVSLAQVRTRTIHLPVQQNEECITDCQFIVQILGFVVGPGLQAAVTPLDVEGFYLLGIPFNMYTMAGWINVLMGLVNFVLFLPWSFKEHRIAAREAMYAQGKASGEIYQSIFVL